MRVEECKRVKSFGNDRLSLAIGVTIVGLVALAALFGPYVAPFGQNESVGGAFEGWSRTHWLGTDQVGRDVFSRLLYGARNTVGLAFLTTCIAFFLGASAGIVAAVVGGWVDQLLGRIVDVMMAIPQLIFALLILTVLGASTVSLIGVIAILDSTRVFRLARSVSVSLAVTDYVDLAKLRGERLPWIVFVEILPNALPILLAEFGLRFCFVILFISALSFLGLGLQPPLADWGSMVRESASLFAFGDITPLVPAAAIALLTVGVNLLVDWYTQKVAKPEA